MNMKKLTSNNKKQKFFAPDNYEFKPPNGLPKMPLFGLVQVEQTPQEKGDFFIQNKSTECKTVDRNEQKDTSSQKLNEQIPNTNGTTTNFNARKEQQQRLGICPRLSSDEIPTKDTVMKNLNISVEEEERPAQYFKFLLNKETERLKELCRKWWKLDIKLEKDIPDDAMYEIHQAVGQEELVHKETHTKSAHKVNFDDQIVLNEVPLDEEEQTKLNLSFALRRIDSLDLDELSSEECFHAEKKLNFETDDNSDHFDDMNEISTEIQRLDKEKPNKYKLSVQDTFDSNAHLLNTTFVKESSPSDARIISLKKKLKYQNQHKNMENLNISATPLETEIPSEIVFINIIPATPLETATPTILNMIEMENHDLGIKILRNRTVTTLNIHYNNT